MIFDEYFFALFFYKKIQLNTSLETVLQNKLSIN